jgi:flagellin
MSLVIATNIASLNAQQNLQNNGLSLNTSLQRLSSGLRINSAADDAAGLAISDRFTTQINGLNQASKNANDGISLSQTAGGALAQVTANLQSIRQLAVQSANATNSASDRAALDQAVQQDIQEINRIATQTSFNNRNVLDGTFGTATFQVGANVGQTISVGLSTSAQANSIGSFVSASGNSLGGTAANNTTLDNTVVTAATGAGASVAVSTVGSTPATNTYQGVDSNAFLANLTINGTVVNSSANYAGSATFTQNGATINTQDASSAYAKALAVNATGVAGVSATASNTQTFAAVAGGVAGTSDFLKPAITGAGSFSYTLTINGQSVIQASGALSIAAAVNDINKSQSQTGVVASQSSSGQLVLTAADGRNIVAEESFTTTGATAADTVKSALSTFTAGAAASSTDLSNTYRGQLTLNSNANITLGESGAATTGLNAAGFSNTATLLATSSSLGAQNVLTVAGANNTILSVDAALTAIDSLNSTFGAIQNRFQSTIASIGTATTNLSAARSRIQDADFAAETSNLTRAQILQQAGTSILAQANALPQGVLKLLQ